MDTTLGIQVPEEVEQSSAAESGVVGGDHLKAVTVQPAKSVSRQQPKKTLPRKTPYDEEYHFIDMFPKEPLDWCDEALALKEWYHDQVLRYGPEIDQRHSSFTKMRAVDIYQQVKTLRLFQANVSVLDGSVHLLRNLRELSLTGNPLRELTPGQAKSLPVSLQHLVLNMTGLTIVPDLRHLTQLQHVGLAYNRIESLQGIALPPALLSLDLSHNNIWDLQNNVLKPLLAAEKDKSANPLKLLCLQGNPVSLLKIYRALTCTMIASLEYLDDQPVDVESDRLLKLPPAETINSNATAFGIQLESVNLDVSRMTAAEKQLAISQAELRSITASLSSIAASTHLLDSKASLKAGAATKKPSVSAKEPPSTANSNGPPQDQFEYSVQVNVPWNAPSPWKSSGKRVQSTEKAPAILLFDEWARFLLAADMSTKELLMDGIQVTLRRQRFQFQLKPRGETPAVSAHPTAPPTPAADAKRGKPPAKAAPNKKEDVAVEYERVGMESLCIGWGKLFAKELLHGQKSITVHCPILITEQPPPLRDSEEWSRLLPPKNSTIQKEETSSAVVLHCTVALNPIMSGLVESAEKPKSTGSMALLNGAKK